ncbi:dienelactone hydrolase family protein [Litoribrevibacter euphylliae]|uniref:Dienelactone hydrolase family protein n=1 Tax=Litoribrevibacter euphylliae TaxID=1834034 RepID=A0ABV7HD10_9GAMM
MSLILSRFYFLLILMGLSFSSAAFAQGRTVDYSSGDQKYEGYFISAGSDAPLVILIHDWDGLTDYEIERANMLKALGYSVFAADLFGKGVRPTEVKDKRQHTGELYKDRVKMRRLLRAALKQAQSLGGNTNNAVAMGYCFGGAAVLEWARTGDALKGFATFHGGLATPEGQSYQDTQGKILVMHGSADTAITMDQFAALTNELEAAGINHEMITYSGAPHAFTVFGSSRYRKDADKKSWARFTGFLESELKE